MKILAIETSCDETAISIIDAQAGDQPPHFQVLAHTVASQIKLHADYGGVVPMLAKREHGKNLIPLLQQALRESGLLVSANPPGNPNAEWEKILVREPELGRQFAAFIPTIKAPSLDLIAVTSGPGLEPALWVGINFAKALARAWNKPLMPINHLEGHILSPLVDKAAKLKFPALALVVSGGHTELVWVKDWLHYQVVGQTRDDAAGEAFDKVARILGLPYPGGPEISKLALTANLAIRQPANPSPLPRPMLHSPDLDFSFSGLKTAVLYLVKKIGQPDEPTKAAIAAEFQQAVIDVLVGKTLKAIEQYQPATVVVAGGVIANQALRAALTEHLAALTPAPTLLFPTPQLATDNATMIAVAAYFRQLKKSSPDHNFAANGNLPLA